jgi:hypothetical protein
MIFFVCLLMSQIIYLLILGLIIFGSVFIKKNNQIEIKKKKPNRNRFKPTGFGSVRFFWTKTGLARFFFLFFFRFGFSSVFSVLGL